MKRFIELTTIHGGGATLFLNPDFIIGIYNTGTGSHVTHVQGAYIVSESPSEVLNILEEFDSRNEARHGDI
jgi:uncharacterized protein YlzI (FlbEa/FlbD family)